MIALQSCEKAMSPRKNPTEERPMMLLLFETGLYGWCLANEKGKRVTNDRWHPATARNNNYCTVTNELIDVSEQRRRTFDRVVLQAVAVGGRRHPKPARSVPLLF